MQQFSGRKKQNCTLISQDKGFVEISQRLSLVFLKTQFSLTEKYEREMASGPPRSSLLNLRLKDIVLFYYQPAVATIVSVSGGVTGLLIILQTII